MSNKRQAMVAKQKARRNKRVANKKVKKEHNREMFLQRAVSNSQGRTIAQLANDLVDSGVKIKAGKPPKNEEVLVMLADISSQLIVMHAGIEIVETLLKEQGRTFTEQQQAIVDKVDLAVIKVSEDTNVILEFIDAKRNMEDFLDVFLHLTNYVQEIGNTSMYGVYEEVIQVEKDTLLEYLDEHMGPGEGSLNFSFPYHNKRVSRISSKYATKVSAHTISVLDVMQASAVQLFGEEGLEPDSTVTQSTELQSEQPQ